jgi:hypothetical protein
MIELVPGCFTAVMRPAGHYQLFVRGTILGKDSDNRGMKSGHKGVN